MRVRVVVVVCVGVALVLAGGPPPTGAYFHDSGASTGIAMHGGVLDVKLNETGPATQDSTTDEHNVDVVTDTWEDLDHSTDGSDTVSNTLAVNNSESSLAANTVDLTVSYVENDTGLGSSGNPDDTATTIGVTAFVYNGSDLVGTELTDLNDNGKVDVHDLTSGTNAQNLSSLTGVAAGESVSLTIRLSGSAGLLDNPSGDGIDITVDVQCADQSFRDTDVARNSTIRYA